MRKDTPAVVMLMTVITVTAVATSRARGADYVGQLSAEIKPTRVVVYKKVDDRELHLNIFEPEGFQPTDRRACFLTIHGGGWTGLGPYRQYPFADHFAKLGMVSIAIDYRLHNPKAGTTVFDCVKDCRSAMRYVRVHAGELGIDPDKIIVNGGSAGGHLAAATAMFDGVDGVDDAGEETSVSCKPCALVLFFPVIDTSQEGYGAKKVGERWRDISPAHQVKPGIPPTIIFHGTGDTVTPFKGAQAFHDAMIKAGNRCELVVTEGAQHGYLMRTKEAYEKALQGTEDFLSSLGYLEQK